MIASTTSMCRPGSWSTRHDPPHQAFYDGVVAITQPPRRPWSDQRQGARRIEKVLGDAQPGRGSRASALQYQAFTKKSAFRFAARCQSARNHHYQRPSYEPGFSSRSQPARNPRGTPISCIRAPAGRRRIPRCDHPAGGTGSAAGHPTSNGNSQPRAVLSYGSNIQRPVSPRAATHIDRLFRSAKVADLPVQLPTKHELVVNLKTAKAIGLTIPEGSYCAQTC